MKKSQQVFDSLNAIVEQTIQKMSDTVIVKVGEQYAVFNRYSITRTPGGITVFRRQDHLSLEFDRMKHAMIWITLDYNNRYAERDRIRALDSALASVGIDKKIHDRLKRKNQGNPEQFLLYKTKLDVDVRKEKRIIAEIDKYYKLANTISHIQGNKNEPNRISSTKEKAGATRTSRTL